MTPDLRLAARTLALDLATGEVWRAFDAAGIDCVVLKGPATVHRLYDDAPGTRDYGDIDLAVAPRRFGDAGRVLTGLGFVDRKAGIRGSEAARLQERPWHRDASAHVTVDLHRGFHNVTDPEAWWELLENHRDVLVVEGQAVVIPDPVGCALIAALHASKASSGCKPLEDLRRAIEQFSDGVWRQAADLAGSVGAGGAFSAALDRRPPGAELATRLGLPATNPAAWFEATALTRGADALNLLRASGSWRKRAERIRDAAVPSRAALAGSRPLATRGRAGLAVARIDRLCVVVTRLPPLLLAWYRSSRATPPPRRRA